MVATTMMGKIERDNDVSPDEIGNCGATRSWQQWPDYKLAAISKVATRRWCGDGEGVRALPHCGGSSALTVRDARASPLWRLEIYRF